MARNGPCPSTPCSQWTSQSARLLALFSTPRTHDGRLIGQGASRHRLSRFSDWCATGLLLKASAEKRSPQLPSQTMRGEAIPLFALSTAVVVLAIVVQTLFQTPTPNPPSNPPTNTNPFPTFPASSSTMGNKSMKPTSPSLSADARSLVDTAITSHPVVIFSKSYCPYCHTAKSEIARAGSSVANFAPPKVYELDRMGALGSAVQAHLAKKTGRRTVPNVFVGGKTVGGGDDVAGYARRNVLKQMLTQAPDRIAALQPPVVNDVKKETPPQSAQQLVEDAVKKHPVVIFSKSYCPYCKAAKGYIADAGQALAGFPGATVFELDHMAAMGKQIQAYLAETTGRNSVPRVFIEGASVGGADDLSILAAEGELIPLIKAAMQKAAGPGDKAGPSENPAKTLVDKAIKTHPVVVFSKSYCPYCVSTKANLQKAGKEVKGYQPAKVFELDTMGSMGQDVQEYLAEKTGQRTVPNIFIGRKHIGGNDDLSGYIARGELKQLLIGAPAAVESGAAITPVSATKEIVFGAGCFWGVELAFQRVVGVVRTEVGYSNGNLPRVTYEAVCSGRTGSAEVVRVTYDLAVVSLTELLKVWEGRHDPTSMNKQGNDVGTQYRSGVYYNDDEQKAEIEKWKADATSRLSRPVVSEIAPVRNYCSAEEYHQRYLEKKGQSAQKGAGTRIRCYG